MNKKKIAVMDIGSSKIRVIIANINSKKNFEIVGVGEVNYAGFSDGEFLEKDKLKKALETALSNAETSASFLIKELYVGIPAEFLLVKTTHVATTFALKRKIKKQDLYELFDKGNDLKFSKDYTLISCNPVTYTLDSGKTVYEPENLKSHNLSAFLSYEYADNSIISLLNSCFEEIGLASVDYVSSPLSEYLYLLDEHARKDMAIIVDCGYIATHVVTGKNGGLLSLSSFSVGGAHIMSDLSQIIKLDYEEAENLKRKAILATDESSNSGYEVSLRGNLYEVPATIVSGIIKARIDMICEGINKAIELSGVEYPKYMPIFLTGGGLLIKGAREYLSKALDRPIEVLSPKIPQFNKPQSSSIVSLCNFATEKEYENSHSFLAKLFGK